MAETKSLRPRHCRRTVVGGTARSGPEALHICARERADVVLLDAIGAPVDPKLFSWGIFFSESIWRGDVRWAERAMDAIDDRVLELKREAGTR